MTREEAAKYFKRHLDLYCVDGISREAEEMAIQALSQEPICDRDCEHCTWTECPIEPCDDAISRDAVCNIVNDIRDCISVEGYCAIIERLKKLPPVTQKPETVTEFADRCRECGKMRKGHWIHFAQSDDCSECGWSTGKYISPGNYCPNCGARMENEEG